MKTTEIGNLEVGDKFIDITAGSNTEGFKWIVTHVGSIVVTAYMCNDIEAEAPTEFYSNEVVEIAA